MARRTAMATSVTARWRPRTDSRSAGFVSRAAASALPLIRLEKIISVALVISSATMYSNGRSSESW